MNSVDYSHLKRLIDHYSKKLHHRPFNANTYLTIGKPTPENLNKYSEISPILPLSDLSPAFFSLYSITKLFLHISCMSLLHLITSLITPFEWIRFGRFGTRRNVHFLILEILPSLGKKKRFSSSFPKSLKPAELDGASMQVILNGTRLPWLYLRKIFLNNRVQFLIIPKTLNPIATLNILILNYISILKLLKSTSKIDSCEKVFVVNLIKHQFSRSTMANQILEHYLQLILRHSPNLESTLLTVEGHTHEKIWIESVQKLSREIRINLYQHAPILENQPSFYENINLLSNTDFVHFSGQYPLTLALDWFKFHSRIDVPTFSIAGSDKFIKATTRKRQSPSTVLFLPEGTVDATLELFELFLSLNELRLGLKMVFRLHPSIQKSRKVKAILNIKEVSNPQVSSNSLFSDLSESLCSIYRGSAASIQGLALGVIPIHFSPHLSFNLDPIPQDEIKHPVCHSSDEIAAVLDDLIHDRPKHNLDSIANMARFSNEYFSNPQSI